MSPLREGDAGLGSSVLELRELPGEFSKNDDRILKPCTGRGRHIQ
jgi:hypothetical protein